MTIAADVWQAVTIGFAEADRPQVLTALERYQWRYEVVRVHRAALVLADGNAHEVERLVVVANQDYRDLLYWAETPEESGAGTDVEMDARYRGLGFRSPFSREAEP